MGEAKNQIKKWSPNQDWVEQDPLEMFEATLVSIKEALKSAGISLEQISSVGLTNQRETTIIWDKKTGKPVYPALVWEDKRTAEYCRNLEKFNQTFKDKTGLFTDPYFSASKIRWILDEVRPEPKNILFGTVDSWIIWNLTGKHLTDQSNASRTLLFNITKREWDEELLGIFKIPESILPTVLLSHADFGLVDKRYFGIELPIKAVVGDQQSALFALDDLQIGSTKVTYGTGAFAMQFLGEKAQFSDSLMTTLQPFNGDKIGYAMEGKVEQVGAAVEKVLAKPDERRETFKKIAMAVNDKIKEFPSSSSEIFVDGGVTQSAEMCQIQADISHVKILRPKMIERTALGAAKLTGDLQARPEEFEVFES